ncbi:MAG: hypothetical protein RIR26_1774 [Pseudomonadota bacterium]|jgi:2,3-diketo-5-methylthiopentyl-1-phosphate enolase
MMFSPKNKSILPECKTSAPHAVATYRVDKKKHGPEIFEEIAIGQTLGAWDERVVDPALLRDLVAKVMTCSESETHWTADIAFPWPLWQGELSWLLTLIFGKMSFYAGCTLADLRFEEGCFESPLLRGPCHTLSALRESVGVSEQRPLLMGILKPNVAMSDDTLADLYAEVAHAGLNLVKDDEIRHDASFETTLRRVEKVAARKQKENLKTLYVLHAPINAAAQQNLQNWSRQLENAGADALLLNVWTAGLSTLQALRSVSKIPIVAHPALAGALGHGNVDDSVQPEVLLASMLRAAGADLTLFPSPYGKIGLPLATAQRIKERCSEKWSAGILPTIPVPSAGIKPEHVERACHDFGKDFILNAGTAIFASGQSVAQAAGTFIQSLEACHRAQ